MDRQQPALPEPENSLFGQVIYAYTRAQALADGVLVNVTEPAIEVGFKLPVAITEALHSRLTPTRADQVIGQDYDARLWDALWLAAFTIRLADPATESVIFTIALMEIEPKSGWLKKVDIRIKVVCGPGDEDEPVITIGLPEDF